MSAEFDLVRGHKNRRERRIAREAEPIFSRGLQGLDKHEGIGTISPDLLLRLIGKSSIGFVSDRAKGLYDFRSDLVINKLQSRIAILIKRAMSDEQTNVIRSFVAPHFERVHGKYGGVFTYAYGFFAGIHCGSTETAHYSWPVNFIDLTLDGEQTDRIEEFARNITGFVKTEQPYLYEFITGEAGIIFDAVDQSDPVTTAQLNAVRSMAIAGVGLAATQLQIEYNAQLDPEMADLAF